MSSLILCFFFFSGTCTAARSTLLGNPLLPHDVLLGAGLTVCPGKDTVDERGWSLAVEREHFFNKICSVHVDKNAILTLPQGILSRNFFKFNQFGQKIPFQLLSNHIQYF